MSDNSDKLREQLFDAQEMTPALRDAYRKEVERMFNEPLTTRKILVGLAVLALLVLCTLGIVRTMLTEPAEPLILLAWATLAGAFSWASYLIVRDLRRGKHSPQSARSIAGILTNAAGTLTVVVLILGLREPSDPASMFNAFYVFVFYVACLAWGLDTRIGAAELAAREQMLRIECRLAELGERLT